MNEFKSNSQAGQDKFVWEVTGHKTDGTFWDVGCGHPIDINNTYALEQIGWTGLLVDSGSNGSEVRANRKSKFLNVDATRLDWNTAWAPGNVTYLSLDCNGATLPTLRRIPFNRFIFSIITVEHDKYRFGVGIQQEMRGILRAAGYELIFSDVLNQGNPFEDWWIKPGLVDDAKLLPYRVDGMEWSSVVK